MEDKSNPFSFFLKKINQLRKFSSWKNYLKWPKRYQWAQLAVVFSEREKKIIAALLILILIGAVGQIFYLYFTQTEIVPGVGGEYREGIIGQPRFINPILGQTNDADRDLIQLIFSGLFKYDGKGNLIPDLAVDYQISQDGLVYDIQLRKDVYWHDGEKLTAADVVFTIKTIQDPIYKSPLRNNWQGVEVNQIDDYKVRFKLRSPYAPFLHHLTVGILPKHLWQGISAQNFALAEYNLKPIGSGPYKFKNFEKDKNGAIRSVTLERNEKYYLQKPWIKKVILKFYPNQEKAVEGYNNYQIDGISFLEPSLLSKINQIRLRVYEIDLPRYYALFFNPVEKKILKDREIRLALIYGLNREELIQKVAKGKAKIIHSPFPVNWLNLSPPSKVYSFDFQKAQQILEENKWIDLDKDGFREKEIDKEVVKLEFELTTSDWPSFVELAQLIKEQWERLGIKVALKIVDAKTIQQEIIRARQYEILLFGEVLGPESDPFAFWHSSQIKDPGLNLTFYQNEEADRLLEEARQTLDKEERKKAYEKFQEILLEDIPVIFLYNLTYLYPVNQKVKGINLEKLPLPSYRFAQIENWYIKTKRIWRK